MKKLKFKININATAQKVWQVLWNDSTYRKWTSAFHEGSYAVSEWETGSKIQFLTPDGDGMYSIIEECKPKEFMAFKHLGVVKKFVELANTDDSNSWNDAMETYSLKEENGNTTLEVSIDAVEEFLDYFQNSFPKAIALVKEIAEQPIMITIKTSVAAPVEKVWQFFTSPVHITKWNNASDDWHTTKAENDLRVGGRFVSRMEAKDGSFGFDFGGVYDEVKTNELIAYTMDDGRTAKITFTIEGNSTRVIETFEAESENSIELQQGGWQAILDNFKKYVEAMERM